MPWDRFADLFQFSLTCRLFPSFNLSLTEWMVKHSKTKGGELITQDRKRRLSERGTLLPPVSFHAYLPDHTLHHTLFPPPGRQMQKAKGTHARWGAQLTRTQKNKNGIQDQSLGIPTTPPEENHPGRKPTEPQTPTAMDPEDVATNTLITISTVGKRTPPNTPLLGKSLDKSRGDAGRAGARSVLDAVPRLCPQPSPTTKRLKGNREASWVSPSVWDVREMIGW